MKAPTESDSEGLSEERLMKLVQGRAEWISKLTEEDRLRVFGGPEASRRHREMSQTEAGKAHLDRMRQAASSPEARAKLSAAQTGRKHSPETIEKMKAAQKARFAATTRKPEKAPPSPEDLAALYQARGERMKALWADPAWRERHMESRRRSARPRSPEFCAHQSQLNRERAGKIHWSEEAKANFSASMRARGKKHSAETKAKMSEARLKHLQTAGFEFLGRASLRFGEIPFRSTWEMAFLWYASMDPRIEHLRYESIFIPYMFDGVQRWYVPDFEISMGGETFLIEVKPLTFVRKDQQTKAKFRAALHFCRERSWTFTCISELELKSTESFVFPPQGDTRSTTYVSQQLGTSSPTGS